ncbi:Asp-tRNA(Asn)/Glu-tRNA(Gln) amidotransferase subunit GatA [Psychromarinibacter sp. C21-152]|uniref:Glutamyl-tRNA(Gln) amidotransferase subunit A n=1 Tax=Psychromarinibacter sediminicola TaxID=3033385 RepID=A0AAE3NL13_9RHOB|nr:Asp-tRNA(Asn)/Glu-tRNA(Gln) amidotransferase subunit GatA [Psychromarinibacter sediminicola]MDF0599868.1 Asp-tRNA(Asn)/Glu-tRNA(Gln) amidotransferase subunit GatA [Psychromarinibacter sediminicola]
MPARAFSPCRRWSSEEPRVTNDLTKLTIAEARDRLRAGDVTSVELTEACLSAIDAADALNAFVHKTPEIALDRARAADERLQGREEAPAMCGIPIGIKDLFCTEGVPSQAASRILDGFRPEYESTVSRQLKDAGAVMLGKLNMDEFAMGSSNETSVYGDAVNPWRREGDATRLTPGGSSGGSASAVAADLCLGATGTDTGGSIRQPAAFTGITGIKPTYGRCSRWGIVAFASSLDQAGPMTRDVRDAAIMLQAMCGHDMKDSTSADLAVPDFEAALTGDIKGRKIGLPREYRMEGMPAEIEKLWADGAEMLRDAGAEVVDISLPHTKYALPAYYVIAPAEASSNLARYDGVRYGRRAKLAQGDGVVEMYEKTRAEGFGHEVQRRVMVGTYVLSAGFYDAYYNRARKVRTLIKRDFEQVFADGVDAILTPATPSAAFGLGEMSESDPVQMYLNDVFTVTVNLAGLPGISVPAGLDTQGLPLGLQLIGRPWEEAALLNGAYALERAAGFVSKPAKWW